MLWCESAGGHARLAAEALDVLVLVVVALVQDLQRDRALEHAVVRAEDARHPARPDELLELVSVCEDVTYDQRPLLPRLAASLIESRSERLFPDAERLLELGVGDDERRRGRGCSCRRCRR